MATKKPPMNENRSIAKWDEELAKAAAKARGVVANIAQGKFISARAGQLSFNGQPFPGNKLCALVVDFVRENVLYEGAFDAENPQSPVCFAFGREDREMRPHEMSTKKQNETCGLCPMNAWGSAEKGRGKACKNRMRLAVIAAGTLTKSGEFELIKDPKHFQSAEIAYINLSVMSVKDFAGYVQNLDNVMHLPPFGVYTEISVVPDPKAQFKWVFKPLGRIPNEIIPALMARVEEAEKTTEFPYQPSEEAPATPAKNSKAAPKAAAKKSKRF